MGALLTLLPNLLRRRKREALLVQAKTWPVAHARLLTSSVLPRDAGVEGGTAFQTSQVESRFYFTVNGAYFGGYVRSAPLSDSEAHRALKLLAEDTEVYVRYNPENPDRVATLAEDNPAFPGTINSG